nr:MAG TPA: tail protein [Caudoviricetes sp.]
MFNNNTSYQEAINAPSRRITGNVTIKGQKLSDDISSIDYVSSISGNTLTIGATNASTVDIKFKRLIEGLEEKELIKVSFSVQTSSGIIERQIGEFFLTEIKLDRNNKTTTLKAIDKMAFLNDKYTSTLLYPTLGRNIVQEIANSCNLRVNNNLNITSLPSFSKKLEKVTYREMLGYLAQTVGAFVIFNNNGELEFRKLNRTQKQISKGSYLLKGLEVDEVEYRINGISISLNNQEKTILAVGSPLGTQVKLTNPLMTQGWLNSIFSEYSKLRFNPFKLNWRGDPFVEVGDWVSIEIANGSYRAFPILELKLSYSGGLKSTIGANVKGTTTSTTEYQGTVERQIEFINARLGASGNYVYADTVEPTNPKEGDTWFKPNGAFTDLYIYENNQWVLKTSTGNIEGLITKITDSSVSTQNLATAIAKIIELDAARITTGSLSFEQLNSNAVSEIRKGMVSETKFNSFVNDSNGLRQQMSSEIERVVESKKSTLKGQDGTSSYIHRKYSDNANGTPMSDNSNLKYLGIYTGSSATPPTTPTSYTWSKIKGEDGRQGVPGVRGADGRTSYLHTAYANSPTGDVDFSTTNSNGKEYIGTYSDFEINDSNDYRRYKWMKIKGENGRDGNNGRDGRNGDSYTRNYLSGTADEKILTAVNDNFVTQEAFKLVDNKNFRDLGFNIGDKVTFIADYEVLPNGTNKKISKLNFEWYDDNRYRFWMNQDLNPTKGTFTRTITANSDLLDCKRAFLRTDNVNAKIKITNARVIKGDTVQPWSIAQEDLQGHTLTANLWFSGNYINNVTKNVRLNLVLFYDGKEVRDFTTNVTYKSGVNKAWRSQENLRTLGDGTIDYGFWGDGEKNGEALTAIATVNYKGLEIVSTARLDNVPNVEDVKETIKKFKTFESTLDSFKSVIGEIKGKEIKTIVNTPNLCTEDFSNNKTKSGNDLYFNVSPNLKANTKYTIIVHAVTKVPNIHQKTRVYGAKSGGGEQWLKSGLNVWVVDYATEQTRVNIYQLGNSSEVTKVEIYEGDYKEYIDKNNRFTSLGALTNHTSFYSYRINHNIPVAKGKFYLVQFDLATLPDNRWFSAGDGGTELGYDWGFEKLNEELKLKDNEYIFEAFYNEEFYIFHSTNSLKITNVRLYEVRFGVTLATQSSLIDISSMIDQTKDSVTLSARKEIEGKLTNYPTNTYLSNNFANKRDLESLVTKSELKVLSDRIESSVNTGNFGTTLSQNAYYVKVAWNGISNYVQFENGGLNFYEGDNTQNNLRARIDDGNYTFWRDGYNLGNMGTGYYKFDPQKKGIQFHLEYDGWFMGWAYKQKRTDNFYTWKWYYTSGSVGDTYADTLNAGCNTNFRWNEIWYFKTKTSWFNITDGLNGTISVVSNIENTGDGGIRWWTRNLTFKNGILIGG